MESLASKMAQRIEGRHFLWRLAGGLLLLNLVVAGITAWSGWQILADHKAQLRNSTADLAQVLESEVAGTLRSVELVLRSVNDELERQQARGRVDEAALNAYIERVRHRLPLLDAIRITDAQGILRYGTGVRPEAKISLADRPHFVRLRGDASLPRAFSKPQKSRVNNTWVIVLAHPLRRSDGSFDGMLFAALPLSALSHSFASMNAGRHDMVALRDEDLELVARYPEPDTPHAGAGSTPPSLVLQQKVAAGEYRGQYQAISEYDGVERIVSYRQVADYPFYVLVGWSIADHLQAARAQINNMLGLVMLFLLMTLAAGVLIYQGWRRQQKDAQRLADSEARLNALFENMGSGVAVYRRDAAGRFIFTGFNRAAESMEGLPRTAVLGRPVDEVFPGIHEFGLLKVFERVWQSGQPERYPLGFYKDGRISGWRENYVYKLPSGEVVAIYEDQTARKQAEEALRLSEQQYRATFDHAAVGIAQVAPDGRFLDINQVFCDIIGYSREEVLGQGFTFQQITLPEDLAPDLEHVQRLLDGESDHYSMEKRYIRKDGGIVWVSLSVALLRDAAGLPLYFISSVSDISARKAAEEKVSRSLEQLNEAQRIAQIGSWELDLISGELHWSDEVFRIFELDPARFAASYEVFLNAIHPEDRDRVNAAYQGSLKTREEYEVTHRLLMTDGRIKWVHERGRTFYDEQGRPLRSMGTVQDITERKAIEDALREREAYNTLLFAESRVPMVVMDAVSYRYLDCNRAAVEIYRLPDKQAVLGLTPLDVSDATQYDGTPSAIAAEAYIAQALEQGSVVFEWRHRHRSGEIWDARVHLMRMQQGERNFLLFTLEDITEQRRNRDELRKKTEALQRSNADLERFAYSVSHDMRQPLRAISGHLQLLARSLKDKLDAEDKENLGFALEGAKRMDSMILSLLEFSRVGRKTEAKQKISSRMVLDEALSYLQPMIEQAGATVAVSGVWPEVYASRDEMVRLLQNLIGNGLKYHEADQPARVEVNSEVGENWRVCVRDYGIGIDPKQIDRLFQFFSRLQARSKFEGTGMGLALCRRIVEHHGGRIWAESEGEGKGSSFCFEMPLNATPEAQAHD